MKTKLIIYRDKREEYRWAMVDSRSNQLIAAASEGYKRRIDCVRNLERVATVGRPGVRFQRGRRGERVSMEIET